MKNRASLILMEQLVMVLVFALAASVCLGVFVKADQISRDTARRDEAVLLAQNGVEVLKSCAGDLEKAAQLLDGTCTDTDLTAQNGELTLKVQLVESGITGLGQAQLSVYRDEELVFSLQTGWQEVAQ